MFWGLLGVDLVLGPLLTITVYKRHGIKWLFNLAVILALQLAAFVYGLSMIEKGRSVWLAFVVDDFELLTSTAIERSAQSRFAETYRDSWSRGPALSLPTIRVIPSLPGRSVMMRCLRGGARGSPSCSIRASFSAVGSGCCRHTSTPSGRCTRSAAPGATGKAA